MTYIKAVQMYFAYPNFQCNLRRCFHICILRCYTLINIQKNWICMKNIFPFPFDNQILNRYIKNVNPYLTSKHIWLACMVSIGCIGELLVLTPLLINRNPSPFAIFTILRSCISPFSVKTTFSSASSLFGLTYWSVSILCRESDVSLYIRIHNITHQKGKY